MTDLAEASWETWSGHDMLSLYEGRIVPRSFEAAYVVISFLVSLVGSISALELINRRTSRSGWHNHLLLLGTSVSMGGIAIWCMHFIGNRAIRLGNGEVDLRIIYSSRFTAISFFIPILVLLTAFLAMGTNNRVSWWRIVVGGTLAGTAICGMHYLGNASIENYTCVYNVAKVVGSAIIAVAASIVALALFFVFRATWTNSWYKRMGCAVVLAGAVSGMHWCASTGTEYRLLKLSSSLQGHLSRDTTVIVVICLSVVAALIMAGLAVYSGHVMRRYAHKAQQVVVAAAVFDKSGRILVSPAGLLPSEKITDTYIEKTPSDIFSISNPLFHWMFQASRNWSEMSAVINDMLGHLSRLPKANHDSAPRLIDEDGQLIENYDVVFRELFCGAAVSLADKMREPLANVGILWDEILPTGASFLGRRRRHPPPPQPRRHRFFSTQEKTDSLDSEERGRPRSTRVTESELGAAATTAANDDEQYGRGSLMFLVRRLGSNRETEKLQAAGYRFADISQVSGIIRSSMQIKTRDLNSKLLKMASYGEDSNLMEPGVHMGFFGIKARVGGHGFDVLVQSTARNLLPSKQLPLENLEPWQTAFMRQLDGLNVPSLIHILGSRTQLPQRELHFASQLFDALGELRASVNSSIFDDALFSSKVVEVPCRSRRPQTDDQVSARTCSMITLRLVIPIHAHFTSLQYEFLPLNFFKVHQMVEKNTPQHVAFLRLVHQEITPVVNTTALEVPEPVHHHHQRQSALYRRSRIGALGRQFSFSQFRNKESSPAGAASPTPKDDVDSEEFQLYERTASSSGSKDDKLEEEKSVLSQPFETAPKHNFGGIMVSQEISVNVEEVVEPTHDVSQNRRRNSVRDDNLLSSTTTRGLLPGAKEKSAYSKFIEVSVVATGKGEDVYDGKSLGLDSAVVAGKQSDVITFVDELFTICVNERQ